MTDFEIAIAAKICAATGRELKPGDAVVSALVEVEGKFVRSDYAAEAWGTPPVGVAAWWAGRIPASGAAKKPTYNDDVMMDLFRHLAESHEPGKVNFRYVLALLLMRRKRLKFEDLKKQAGQDVLVVRDSRTGEVFDAVDPRLDEMAIAGVQDEVFTALGWK